MFSKINLLFIGLFLFSLQDVKAATFKCYVGGTTYVGQVSSPFKNVDVAARCNELVEKCHGNCSLPLQKPKKKSSFF